MCFGFNYSSNKLLVSSVLSYHFALYLFTPLVFVLPSKYNMLLHKLVNSSMHTSIISTKCMVCMEILSNFIWVFLLQISKYTPELLIKISI